ncbi:MAG: transcription-repair coupling factor [Candidatus Puniceispirillaceae bacterium]
MKLIDKIDLSGKVYGAVDGATHLLLAQQVAERGKLVYVARDDARMAQMQQGLAALDPEINLQLLPAWDCLPYDRVSPHAGIISQRIETLSGLYGRTGERAEQANISSKQIILTTINSWIQKVPPPAFFAKNCLSVQVGQEIAQTDITEFLARNGFMRTQTVREFGEFSLRGGILDIFASTLSPPVRLDFFGDEIESIRYFDALSQRSEGDAGPLTLHPASEFCLDDEIISQFRQRYLALFGSKAARDPLYEAVSAGQTPAGIEHWLGLLHTELVPLSACFADWICLFDVDCQPAATARREQISDFYTARLEAISDKEESVYRPLPADEMYLNLDEINSLATREDTSFLFNFAAPDGTDWPDTKARLAPHFHKAAGEQDRPVAVAAQHIKTECTNKAVILCAGNEAAVARLTELFAAEIGSAPQWAASLAEITAAGCYVMVWPLETGFETPDALVLSEQDIFGARMSRPTGRRRRADNFLREVSSLEVGDLVVHVEHGIGRYEGLETITSNGTQHDCLHLRYAGGDRLYLPVENIELLSRYGQESSDVVMDRLGGVGWQTRKARIKGRIREMADQLIKIAANRAVAKAEPLSPPEGVFAEFCARFGHSETEDQLDAIHDVLGDLGSGQATDRLICGDVGFGKTEVALRAAFVAAMSGYQVALVTPTTLLARQHARLFEARFKGFPVTVASLSRMVTPKQAQKVREGLKDGSVQMVVGTHALLAKSIDFNHLGLLIIDEEQNFGVAQKERLKELRGDVHVLTLSATPIPRTLQLALSGVRDMSLIATPPVDRLAVRTFVGGWDGVVLKEALTRERFRGGQSFVVCPRIADLNRVYDKLVKMVPDLRIFTAHGKMAPNELDDVMTDFGDGKADVLLSTNIIESGIDIPTANTIIIHRADMFGLAQLYQLRGRVGRGKERAYAYLTTDPDLILTPQARRRLDVMQTLDTLGAGFSLASYDMDIRGAGNLLGDEQSGHVREVGIELYQDMLKQAVDIAKKSREEAADSPDDGQDWSPQISLGTNVLIPESYVADLSVRLSLYRRIGNLKTEEDIFDIKAECADRFGDLPDTMNNLLEIVELKQLCRQLNIQKFDAGDKGFALSFRENKVGDPDALIGWIAAQRGKVLLKSDHRIVIKDELTKVATRSGKAKNWLRTMTQALCKSA